MFCTSKGLGAPMGSLLCGSKDFIRKAAETRKMLGGNLRQAGFMAAAAEYALRHNIPALAEDHRRARELCGMLQDAQAISIPSVIQSNIIILDITGTRLSPSEFIARLKVRGLWLSESGSSHVRMLLYSGISDEEVRQAACILKEFLSEL